MKKRKNNCIVVEPVGSVGILGFGEKDISLGFIGACEGLSVWELFSRLTAEPRQAKTKLTHSAEYHVFEGRSMGKPNREEDEEDDKDEVENEEEEADEDDEAEDEDDEPIRRRSAPNNTLRVVILICLAVSLLVVVGITIFVVSSNSGSAKSTTASAPSKPTLKPNELTRTELPATREENSGRDPMQAVSTGFSAMFCLTWVMLPVLYLAISILIGIWVIKDCRNRSMGEVVGVLWMLLIFPFNVVAFIIYIGSRPPGTLVTCRFCQNQKLPYRKQCPHCRRRLA